MLPRRHRLTRPDDYRAVLRAGQGRRRRAGTELLVVHAALGPGSPTTETPETQAHPSPTRRPPRVGFVVSKGVGNSVVRHRVVRRLRALVAARLEQLPDGADLVVRAQPPAATASSVDLAAALDRALDRLTPGGRSR